MSAALAESETDFEKNHPEVDLARCPLCAWPAIEATDFCETGRTSPTFAKIQCGQCGCRISGGSVKDLAPRWNNRPKHTDGDFPF